MIWRKNETNHNRRPALIPGPKGGKLYSGGVPGNRGGGRLPSEIRSVARDLLTPEFLNGIAAIGKGEKLVRTMPGPKGKVKHCLMHPTPQAQVQAAHFLASIGVSRDHTFVVDESLLIRAVLLVSARFVPVAQWPAFKAELKETIRQHVDSDGSMLETSIDPEDHLSES